LAGIIQTPGHGSTEENEAQDQSPRTLGSQPHYKYL